jgi:hypothetical protein
MSYLSFPFFERPDDEAMLAALNGEDADMKDSQMQRVGEQKNDFTVRMMPQPYPANQPVLPPHAPYPTPHHNALQPIPHEWKDSLADMPPLMDIDEDMPPLEDLPAYDLPADYKSAVGRILPVTPITWERITAPVTYRPTPGLLASTHGVYPAQNTPTTQIDQCLRYGMNSTRP